MHRAHHSIFLVAGLTGCAGTRPLPFPTLSDFVNAPSERVLNSAAAEFQMRRYHAYLGNPGLVVATKSESTFWSGPALVAGFVALPVFIATWPVVSLFDQSLHKEVTMWWPARAFAWESSTQRDTTIYLKARPRERGGSWITVEVISPDKAPQYHARQVIDALFELEPKIAPVEPAATAASSP